MERSDRPAEPEEKKRLIEAGFVADNARLGTTWSRSAVGACMTTEEALLLVDAEDKRRRADRLVALVAGGARTVEHAEALLRQIEGARGPYSRCPKCGAVPLADTDDALLCELCNRWYSRWTLPGGSESKQEFDASVDYAAAPFGFKPGELSGWLRRLRVENPTALIADDSTPAVLRLPSVPVFEEDIGRVVRLSIPMPSNAPERVGMVILLAESDPAAALVQATESAAPNWSALTDREAHWIAREAGCDVRAVQLALQGRDGVRDDIRARVLEVAPRIRRTAPSPDSASFHIEARRIMRDVESVASESNDWRTLLERRFGDALRTMYQRGLSERPVPPAAIPLTAAQLRALAESDEAGDAPFVATASALREMVAAQLGWQVQMPVFDADGTRRAERWTVMVPAAGPAAVPGAILLGIGADEIVERAAQALTPCAVCGTNVGESNRLTHCAAQPGTGVLAVVELETRLSEDRTYRVARAVALPAGAPERVTVAVFVPGSKLARAVEAVQRVEALCERREIEDIMREGEVAVSVVAVRAALAGEA